MYALSEMLVAARANLWRAQERLGVKPDLEVIINDDFAISFADGGYRQNVSGFFPLHEPYLKCSMPPDLLRRILTRETHWNNAEVAFDIMFDRRPNTYMPDVHTLMSFFHI